MVQPLVVWVEGVDVSDKNGSSQSNPSQSIPSATSSPDHGDRHPDSANSLESMFAHLRIILWPKDQLAIAGLLLVCLIGMSVFFLHRSYVQNGLIEIDRSGSLEADFQVDINTAQFGEIVVLPGVGEKLARTIVEHRHRSGPFNSVESITQVPGIGDKKLEALIPYLAPIQSQ